MTVIILIIFYTAPLSVLAEVLSTRSSATLYLPFAVMNLVRTLARCCTAAVLNMSYLQQYSTLLSEEGREDALLCQLDVIMGCDVDGWATIQH